MSSQEYFIPSGDVILSTTDLQGNIVDYNSAFCRASGYTDQELMGKPHNILRHPDMPKQAFQDMWQTIQAGRPWFGIVKKCTKCATCQWIGSGCA